MIGTTIAGKYEIIRLLGVGGMGDVYRARDARLERDVALKFLQADKIGEGTARERFVREARAASALDHANLCTMYEISELENDSLFMAMAFYEGQTLWERMEEGLVPVPEAIQIALQMLDGLAHAHERGVLHRDIKPANVMITLEGVVKVLDFGLAQRQEQDRLTRVGTIVGTPAYMSPEQVYGRPADQRSDVWAVGVVLYEMISGQLPHDEDGGDEKLLRRIAKQDARPLEGLDPADLERVGPVVMRALKRDPKERYPTAAEMAADLRAVVGGSDLPSRVVSRSDSASVAVLPFEDLSPDRDHEYFCVGMAEELSTALGKIDGLRVASRTSAARLREQGHDARALGERLDVASLVEGSVRRAGNRIRVSAQLTESASSHQIWSERFDREMDDVFAIQEEIAETIASTLKGQLAPEEQRAIERRPTEKPAAYAAYLRGRHLWNRRTHDALIRGIGYFEQAIDEDAGYADAHAGLADSYVILGVYGLEPPTEVMPKARAAAEAALALDPATATAHTSLACVEAVFDWSWDQAEQRFHRALALDPRYPTASQWLAMHCFLPRRRFDEAEALLVEAHRQDPLSPAVAASLGILERFRGEPETAARRLRQAIELDPSFVIAHRFLGLAEADLGNLEPAIAALRAALDLAPDSPEVLASFAAVQAQAGRTDQSRAVTDRLEALRDERYVSPVLSATVAAALGETDRALESLSTAVEERASDLIWFGVDPALAGIAKRFKGKRILHTLGLDPPARRR